MQEELLWYDSPWRQAYSRALSFLESHHPGRLREFVESFEKFETRRDFEVQSLANILSPQVLREAQLCIDQLSPNQLEMHEARSFGRFVVHNHTFFNNLQNSLTQLVSQLAGEEVEPSYNFLSLYSQLGRCPLHLDAPDAKWTLDICLRQSTVWPIHIGPVTNRRDDIVVVESGWEEKIKDSVAFKPFALEPGSGILFSGSSQWHYRAPIPESSEGSFCDLIFFHYVPKGTKELADPRNWEKIFVGALSGWE